MICLLFGAIGLLAAGFAGVAIGVLVAFVVEFMWAALRQLNHCSCT